MKLQFLGSGSAFVPLAQNFQSNMILKTDNGKCLLIDCGSDARHAMAALGLSHRDINAVYISHYHADHVGGLEWLAFNTYFDPDCAKPDLITHPCMVDRLWDNSISAGLQSLAGDAPATIDTYFKINPDCNETSFIWESIKFEFIKTIHVYNGTQLMPSYGLYFETDKNKVFITTDTQFTPDILTPYYNKADIIFEDCNTTPKTGGVHAHFDELVTLPAEIKAKMWLYHYTNCDNYDAKANGFLGFVVRGQEFEI